MNGFIAFSKKEFTEQFRSYKSIILIAVLFLLGMMSPLLAKMMPDILSGMAIDGITLTIPAATSLDAYSQFFKNVGQMGFIILLLIFSGLLSQDVTKGTLIVLLAKGLSRRTVILSKFTVALILWTVAYVLSAVTAFGYTVYLFGSADLPNLFYALFCLWFFGVFILALLICASTLTSGNFGGLILSAGALLILLILNSFPAVRPWNPVTLASSGIALLSNTVLKDEITKVVWVSLAFSAALLTLSVAVFQKKKL